MMNNDSNQPLLEGVLIYSKNDQEKPKNPSIILIQELCARFNIPRSKELEYDDYSIIDRLAFYGACYLALFKELKGTKVDYWIDNALCDIYSHNGRYPLEQCLEKYAEMKAKKGGNDEY
ncbi:TPA: hypothetical protein ACPORJ_000768 [Haemophilus influenzae]|uniref:hypothetical protein n=1 Tax=Haemophilus influenzae TaxID=727 RepID=UPI000682ECE1|nr:hypothetical protein [Haemophilus influenzae]MCK8884096.1 hypothetical protein [Haemophilus influenzae]PRI45274.1 hypothetical protein BVZ71_00785 [Haemophilus influenzae]PRM36721.1 hypothetical protein BVZ73_01341 [Haemophilus influenzae]